MFKKIWAVQLSNFSKDEKYIYNKDSSYVRNT